MGTNTHDTLIFDIDYNDFRDRRGKHVRYLYPYYLSGDTTLGWGEAGFVVSAKDSAYYGKLKVYPFVNFLNTGPWIMAYFEWDAL